MTIYCLHSRHDGTTLIGPVTLRDPETDPAQLKLSSGRGVTMMTGQRERQGQWHTTPKLGITTIIEGYLDIETNRATPQRVTLKTGDMLLVLDQTGDGHRSRAHGPQGMTALLMPLEAADIPALASLFRDWPTDLAI